MLHIHNGDSTAATARKTAIPGEHLAWREALVCGPTPGGLSEDKFRRVRGKHLSDSYGLNLEHCERELRAQSETLARFSDHEEIVLWFEHDLFCQVHLRGLGQLNEEQLASLFPQRQEASKAQLHLGSRAWQAYSSADPAELIPLMNSDLSEIPFLKRALIKHIQRFPSTKNGLGIIENVGLELIAEGYRSFKSLFPAFNRCESEYGLGDAQLYLELKRLADASAPLLTSSNAAQEPTMDSAKMLLSSFEITELGKAALDGDEDFVTRNGIDYWLGGVHLEGNEVGWRWDEDAKELLVRL